MSGRYATSTNSTPNALSSLPLVHRRVHPAPTETAAVSRVHPASTESAPIFPQAIKRVLDGVSVAGHVSTLKHAREQPKALTTQYDSELEQIYLQEWPDAVPEYKHKHLGCCRRDPQRDNDSRELLKKLFPPYMHYLLAFSGAIPPRSKACFYFVTSFWTLFACALSLNFINNTAWIMALLTCRFDAGCQTAALFSYRQVDFSASIAVALANLPAILSIVLVHTYLRDQLQSRELHTLVASASVDRIRNPEEYW